MSDNLLERLQAANPEAVEHVSPDDLAAVFSTIEEKRHAMTSTTTLDQRPTQLAPTASTPQRIRGWAVAAAAFAVVVVVAAGVTLLMRGDEATLPNAAIEDVGPVPVPLGEVQGLARSGDLVWAWDRDGHIAAYRDGSWSGMPALPDPVVDVAGSASNAWAITTNRCDPTLPDWEGVGCKSALWRLEDGLWQQRPEWQQLPDLQDIEVDPATGTVWFADAYGELLRWDGAEVTRLGNPAAMPNDGIAVTSDGTIWASRFNFYFPTDVGLARYNEDTGSWEAVQPLRGGNHQAVMAPTPNGDLWVWLSEFPSAESFSGEALAYYDSDTGAWTLYEDGSALHDGVGAMTADTGTAWLIGSTSEPWGIRQFDGQTWTRHRATEGGDEFNDIAAAPDGTIWFIRDQDHALYRLDTNE